VKLEAEAQHVVLTDIGAPEPIRLRRDRLTRRLALMLAGSLDERGCDRVVLAAYPTLAQAAATRKSPGRWLRQTLQQHACGLVEDLAVEALRVAGVLVEIKGLEKIRTAAEQLAETEASGGPISGRSELARIAYPLRHPGLRVAGSAATRRPVCIAPRVVRVKRRGRAARPGHARRRRCSSRAPNDPDEPGPGEGARRADDDHVDLRVPLETAA
jgi:hypothetical protein